ncbi:MAG: hypothetical protein SCH39_09730 [Methanosarcinales archaeon]|nr:hypothetical protein [Methanosarcinales archaeon]
MLISNEKKYIKTPFLNEEELEQVVIDNYEYIFGPNSIYLPKILLRTSDGYGTIPDGFAIDLASHRWYLVEAELAKHNVWNHIAPQVSKQIIAAQQKSSKRNLVDLSITQVQENEITKEKFSEFNIKEIDISRVLGDILDKEPIVGIPIDKISDDLKDWARTLKYDVKLWLINKFVEFKEKDIIYEFPEEFKPELDTEEENKPEINKTKVNRYDVSVLDLIEKEILQVGQKLFMEYKPRRGDKKRYEAYLNNDGAINVLGQNFSSPSYAALAGIQDAGSDRQTVNGWTSWKNEQGRTLADLREKYIRML